MVEVMIEHWKNRDGSIDYLWSVWQAGSRIRMGGAHRTADDAEHEARKFCRQALGTEPASVTHL